MRVSFQFSSPFDDSSLPVTTEMSAYRQNTARRNSTQDQHLQGVMILRHCFIILLVTSFPVRNATRTQVKFSAVADLHIFVFKDFLKLSQNIRVIYASCSNHNLIMLYISSPYFAFIHCFSFYMGI